MRTVSTLVLIGLAAAGCRPDFNSLEESCVSSVPGEGAFSADADEVIAVGRLNCYRRLAGLSQHRVDDQISAAARAHARYLALNDYDGLASDGGEDPGAPGFTGEFPWDRFEAQGYEEAFTENVGEFHFWTLDLPTADADIALEIDGWMDHWLTRQIMLQPGVEDGGWGRSGDFTVFTNWSNFPMDERADRPVVYPKDGQSGVPTAVHNGFATSIVPTGTLGYPITITVGSSGLSLDVFDRNPFSLILLDQLVVDPDNNQVDVVEIQPETTQFSTVDGDAIPVDFPYTIALVPEEPLLENTTYRVFARISTVDGVKELASEFTTGAATDMGAAAARGEAISQVKFHRTVMGRR